MSHPSFTVSILERAPLTVFGIPLQTTMPRAAVDCPRLWSEIFGPRMRELAPNAPQNDPGESYGICMMDSDGQETFTYWAAMPPETGLALPEGMQQMVLPGGLYAHTRVPSLQMLDDAYTFLYMGKPEALAGHTPNMHNPCFERYTAEWITAGALELFVPLDKTAS